MAGFSGATGVPKKYVDDKIAQSTAIVCTQLRLPQAVTISANSTLKVLDNADLRSLTYDALDQIPSAGTVKGIVYLWSNGSADRGTYAVDALVWNGLVTLTLRNPSANSASITAVRLIVMLKA